MSSALNKALFLFCLSVFPSAVQAAYLYVPQTAEEIPVMVNVSLRVNLNTEGKSANALSGTISLPADLELVSILAGDSTINLWVRPPALDQSSHSISFAGVTPGGFTLSDAHVFTMVVKGLQPGTSTLTFSDVQILAHDGQATPLQTKTQNPTLHIVSGLPAEVRPDSVDTEAPEAFVPYIVSNPNLFEGSKTLIWYTVDKFGGPVTSYVREGFFARYKKSVSPYRLNDQSMTRDVYIKVVDEAGNERVVTIPATSGNQRLCYRVFALIFLLLLAICLVWKKRHTPQDKIRKCYFTKN